MSVTPAIPPVLDTPGLKVQLRPRNRVGSVFVVVVVVTGEAPASAMLAARIRGRAANVDFIAKAPVSGKILMSSGYTKP